MDADLDPDHPAVPAQRPEPYVSPIERFCYEPQAATLGLATFFAFYAFVIRAATDCSFLKTWVLVFSFAQICLGASLLYGVYYVRVWAYWAISIMLVLIFALFDAVLGAT